MLVIIVIVTATILSQFFLPLPWYQTGLVLPEIYIMGILSALIVSSLSLGFMSGGCAEARRTNAVLSATQLCWTRTADHSLRGIMQLPRIAGSPLNTISLISHDFRTVWGVKQPIRITQTILINHY